MTSNRDTIIDDAIISRATAHIRYESPNKENAIKIWSVLSEQFEIKLHTDEIQKIYEEFKNVSGRDIKNILKLAKLLSKRENKEINLELVKYVSRFLDVGDTK